MLSQDQGVDSLLGMRDLQVNNDKRVFLEIGRVNIIANQYKWKREELGTA